MCRDAFQRSCVKRGLTRARARDLAAPTLLLLARGVADELVRGWGSAASVLLGLGSLVGVFATLFFAHSLSACLGFAAFAVLVRERRHPALLRVGSAGLLAGLAMTVEFPLA